MERGSPVTPMYLDAEIGRMQALADRRAGIRPGPVPRAEPDQVVRSAVRDDRLRNWAHGRIANAVAKQAALLKTREAADR